MTAIRPYKFLMVGLIAVLVAAHGGSPDAMASGSLETDKLPRPAGAKSLHESALTTIYTVPGAQDVAGREVLGMLAKAGLERYVSPFQRGSADIGAINLTFRKGIHGLRVRIAPAPAQSGATAVNLVAFTLRHDIPSPPGSSDLKYDPDRPHLEATTSAPFSELIAFYGRELADRGWQLHKPADGSEPVAGNQSNQRAFFTRDGQRPLLLQLLRTEDARSLVKIEAVPQSVLPGAKLSARRPPANMPSTKAPDDDIEREVGALVEDVLKQVTGQLRDAAKSGNLENLPRGLPGGPSAGDLDAGRLPDQAGAGQADSSAPTPGSATSTPVGTPFQLPLPRSARGLKRDGAAGKLEFETTQSIPELAAFYREALPAEGWNFDRSPVNRSTMSALIFGKDGQTLTITIARIGARTNVFAEGEALRQIPDEGAKRETASGAKSQKRQHLPLEVGDSGGLVVPKPHNSVGRTKSLFRKEAFAAVPASVAAVVAFYRQELAKLGWTEQSGAEEKSEGATLRFTTPEGPALLTMKREGDETHVTLAVRLEAEARTSGLMPRPGYARLLFGNMNEHAGTVVIAGKTIKVGPGVGEKGTDGPHIELSPGEHTARVRLQGKKEFRKNITLGGGEIWGFLLGPGGAVMLQAY